MIVHDYFDWTKTVLRETGVIQIWFSHVPWTEDRAHAGKENMMKNIQQYLFMDSQTGVFSMTMVREFCSKCDL